MAVCRRRQFGLVAAAPAAVVGAAHAAPEITQGGVVRSTQPRLMGEAGMEGILPLRRRPDGRLGIEGVGHVGEFATREDFRVALEQVREAAAKGARASLIDSRCRGGLRDIFG